MDFDRWLNLSEKDLKDSQIRNEIEREISAMGIKCQMSTSDIWALREAIVLSASDKYFKTIKHKIAYLLIHYTPKFSNETLGIQRRHYSDNALAKEWMRKKQKLFNIDINNDKNDGIDYDLVTKAIDKIYKEMVGQK